MSPGPKKTALVGKRKRVYRTKKAPLSVPQRNAVKKIVDGRTETKYTNIYGGSTSAMTQLYSTPGDVLYLSGIAQGDGYSERTGIKINPNELNIKLLLRFYNSKGLTAQAYVSNPVRVLVFAYDNSIINATSPSAPVLTDILSAPGGSDIVMRNYSAENKGTYTILYDKIYNMQLSSEHYSAYDIKLVGRKLPSYVHYTGSGASPASSGKNGIYMALVSLYDPVTGGANGENTHIEYAWSARLAYKDA